MMTEAAPGALAPSLPPFPSAKPLADQRAIMWLWAMIAVGCAVRAAFAVGTGLGIDESYMVAAGRTLQLSYFDHPPISWWLAWAAAHLAGTEAPLVVRLPFILLFALSTWLMFRLAADLFGARAGLWAAVLLNLAPVLGVTSGTWVLPDGPLIAALLGTTLCFTRAVAGPPRRADWWIGVGLCFGLALASKYNAVLTGFGFAAFLLTEPKARRWLARPQPWLAVVVAFVVFIPVLAWNARHGFASLRFQGGRAEGGHWHPLGPLLTAAGEALFFLPWIWLPLAVCVWRALRRGPGDQGGWLLACLTLVPFLFFEVVSLRGHVMMHWAAPGTMLGLPLLGRALAERPESRAIRRVTYATAALVIGGMALVASQVSLNWLHEPLEALAGARDPSLEAVDWTSLRDELSQRGLLRAGTVVAAIRWHDAGKIDYALGGVVPVICLGGDSREYGLVRPAGDYAGRDLLILAPRETLASVTARIGSAFSAIEALPAGELLHAGTHAMALPLFWGRDFRPWEPDGR